MLQLQKGGNLIFKYFSSKVELSMAAISFDWPSYLTKLIFILAIVTGRHPPESQDCGKLSIVF